MDLYLDLKTVNLSKGEFVNILTSNQLFATLCKFFSEEKEKDEVRRIIMNNNYYICCACFLSSKYVSYEKKKRIINYLSFLIKGKVIMKGQSEDDIIEDAIRECKRIKKEGEDNVELIDVVSACYKFIVYARNGGWKEEEEEKKNMKEYKEEIERLKKEIEDEKKKVEEGLREREEERRRNEKLMKELEMEKKKNVECQKLIPITSLSSLSLFFSNSTMMKRVDDRIICLRNPSMYDRDIVIIDNKEVNFSYHSYEACIIGEIMKEVELYLFILFHLCTF